MRHIELNEEDYQRLLIIVGCHIDITIGEKIKDNAKRNNLAEAVRLQGVKESDQLIYNQLLEAKKVNSKT